MSKKGRCRQPSGPKKARGVIGCGALGDVATRGRIVAAMKTMRRNGEMVKENSELVRSVGTKGAVGIRTRRGRVAGDAMVSDTEWRGWKNQGSV